MIYDNYTKCLKSHVKFRGLFWEILEYKQSAESRPESRQYQTHIFCVGIHVLGHEHSFMRHIDILAAIPGLLPGG